MKARRFPRRLVDRRPRRPGSCLRRVRLVPSTTPQGVPADRCAPGQVTESHPYGKICPLPAGGNAASGSSLPFIMSTANFDAARSASANGVMSRGRPRTSFLGQTAPGKLSSTISPGRPPKNGLAPILYRCQDSNRLTAAPDNAAPSAVPATALACESPIGHAALASLRSSMMRRNFFSAWARRFCSSSASASASCELLLESHDQIAAALHNGLGFFAAALCSSSSATLSACRAARPRSVSSSA